MSKAFALPRQKTVDLRQRLASSVASPIKDVAGDPYRDPGLCAPMAGCFISPHPSPTENPRCTSASELDRLHASLDNVTREIHPRSAKLLGSGPEAAEVAGREAHAPEPLSFRQCSSALLFGPASRRESDSDEEEEQ